MKNSDPKHYQTFANISLVFGFLMLFGVLWILLNGPKPGPYDMGATMGRYALLFLALLPLGSVYSIVGIVIFRRNRKFNPDPIATIKLLCGIALCALPLALVIVASIFDFKL